MTEEKSEEIILNTNVSCTVCPFSEEKAWVLFYSDVRRMKYSFSIIQQLKNSYCFVFPLHFITRCCCERRVVFRVKHRKLLCLVRRGQLNDSKVDDVLCGNKSQLYRPIKFHAFTKFGIGLLVAMYLQKFFNLI